MPFTFSHPAIVLPLTFLPKKWLSLTGLIIGSLTPDFEYFLRMKIQSVYSHTFLGVFYFDLPLGLLIAFIFHNLVRDELFNNLPEFIKSRLFIFTQFGWNSYFKRNWIVVLISIIIGAFSHVFWDAFTHATGYFVTKNLRLTELISFGNFQVFKFKFLQHLSTVIGAIVIVIAILKLPKMQLISTHSIIKFWTLFLGISLIVMLLKSLTGLDFMNFGQVFITLISAVLISLILTSVFYKNGCKKSTQ